MTCLKSCKDGLKIRHQRLFAQAGDERTQEEFQRFSFLEEQAEIALGTGLGERLAEFLPGSFVPSQVLMGQGEEYQTLQGAAVAPGSERAGVERGEQVQGGLGQTLGEEPSRLQQFFTFVLEERHGNVVRRAGSQPVLDSRKIPAGEFEMERQAVDGSDQQGE